MLSSNVALFSVANTPEFSYKINEDSVYINNHRTLFYIFGQVLGKALFDNIPVNVCLNRAIYRNLLHQTEETDYTNLDEFKSIDYNVYNSLKFLRDNNLSEHGDVLELYFTHDVPTNMNDQGSITVDLVTNGSTKKVDDSNKAEFIRKKCHYVAYKSV